MVFQEKEQPEELAVESTPRTKGDIIGFNDPEDYKSDESIDVTDIQPATEEGLRRRFHELYKELVFLLDECEKEI